MVLRQQSQRSSLSITLIFPSQTAVSGPSLIALCGSSTALNGLHGPPLATLNDSSSSIALSGLLLTAKLPLKHQ